MDLENYKKLWKNQPQEGKKLSAVEIYKMAHKRSSSIVKWIFIIGILEFVVLNSLYFFVDLEESKKLYESMGIMNIVYYSQIIAYSILFYFLFQFYMNYKKISVIESTKNLLTKIVKTRKTVRNYVIFNLAYLVFVTITISIAAINTNEFGFSTKQTVIFIGVMILMTIIITGALFLFYQLLYGILLRKLKKNYKEIAKLDELN